MSTPFRFSVFRSVQDNRPAIKQGVEALEDLVVDPPLCTSNKKDVPLISPAVYLPGATRSIQNVERCTFLVLDVDKSSEEDFVERIARPLYELGCRAYVHTTHSYGAGLGQGLCKVRVILPLRRPVSPEEYVQCMEVLDELTSRLADRHTFHPASIFYVYSTPPEYQGAAWSQRINEDGPWLDPEVLLSVAPDVVPSFREELKPGSEVLARVRPDLKYRYAQEYLESFDGAIEGEQGDARTYEAACVLGDFGLDLDAGFPLLEAWNKEKCQPPWERADLYRKAQNAYKYRKLPLGWRLVENFESDVVSKDDLKQLTKKLLRSESGAPEGRALRTALKSEPIEPIMDARALLEKVAFTVARFFPNGRTDGLCDHFKEAIEATQAKGARDVSLEWFKITLAEKQRACRERKAEESFDKIDNQRARIRQAFRTVREDRNTPYTRRELDQMLEASGLPDAAAFKSTWILRKGDSIWFRVGHQYVGPYTKGEAMNAAVMCLAPAKINLYTITREGSRRLRSLQELCEDYGSVVEDVVADMSLQVGYYDPETLTLYQAPCPKLQIEPEYSDLVEGWLRLLTPNEQTYERLLDWMATCPNLKEPTCALFFFGAPGTGKSLFANAIARLWGNGNPTEIEDVAGNFNSKLAKNPVVFGDESVPEDWRGEPRTDLLRRLIQERERTLRQKFLADTTLRGAMRMVIAANSMEILASNRKHMNNNDIQAINERFLIIHVPNDAAKRYMELKRREDPEAMREMTHGFAIVKHMLWLEQNREVETGHRLLVNGLQGSEFEMYLMTSSGLRSEVCYWIASYVLNPNKIGGNAAPVVDTDRDGSARIMLTAKMMKTSWPIYCDGSPSIGAIEKSLGALSTRTSKRVGGRIRSLRNIDMERVYYWAENNGVSDRATLQEALDLLRQDTEAG